MRRSTSPYDATQSVNRTKSGRVSKATKGQPVHHCECGKTYTRAEHLRRHKQNHKPGAYPCDVGDCGRAFYREDLLIRHKLRHHNMHQSPTFLHLPQAGNMPQEPSAQSLLPHGQDNDPNYMGSAPPPSVRLASAVASHQPGPQPAEGQSRKAYIPITQLRTAANFGIAVSNTHDDSSFSHANSMWISPLQYSFESTYDTPEPASQYTEQLQPTTLDVNQAWMCRTPTLGPSYSPTSADSRATMPLCGGRSPGYDQLHTPVSENSYYQSRDRSALSSSASLVELPAVETSMSPELRDYTEQNDLMTPTSSPQGPGFGPHQYRHQPDNEQRYLDAYWASIHPSWPVVRKSTFELSWNSPLLRASMYALGASAIGHQVDSANACIIHKRCLKVLRNRTDKKLHSHRICDLQAILLLELFSAFESRRPPFQLSRCFTDSYTALFQGNPDAVGTTLSMDYYIEPFSQITVLELHAEAKQRLLAAYYMLDQLHATLFDRRTNTPIGINPGSLTVPQPLQVWDPDASQHASFDDGIVGRQLRQPVTLQEIILSVTEHEDLDTFTSILLLAYTNDKDARDLVGLQENDPQIAFRPSSGQSPMIELTHKTFDLCLKTPIRSLLAVAGESWIMGEKLDSRAEFKAAQQKTRQWATSASSKDAVAHALEILAFHRTHLKPTLFYYEWSLHLASLVIWARAYVMRESTGRLRLEIPSARTVEVVAQRQELDETVNRVVQRGAQAKCTWADTRGVLMWAKARVEKMGNLRFSGVVSGSVDVLGRLVGRGDEDGWF
ncbi:hypothetical protein Q7P37_005427 [Cladosporium fusiforme]